MGSNPTPGSSFFLSLEKGVVLSGVACDLPCLDTSLSDTHTFSLPVENWYITGSGIACYGNVS